MILRQRVNRNAHRRAAGIGILDAVVGASILLLVTVGVSTQLSGSALTISNSQATVMAQNIANSQVNDQRSLALSSSASSFPQALASGSTSSWSPPSGGLSGTVAGATSFRYQTVGGWCSLNSSGSWVDYSTSITTPPSYWVASKVTWGNGSIYRVAYGQMPIPHGATTPPTATAGYCPTLLN